MSSSRVSTVLLAPTAFKGTLSPVEACRHLETVFRRCFDRVRSKPLADGGDGTLEVLLSAFGGRKRRARVTGPLGRPVRAEWGIVSGLAGLPGRTAVIEMARASGLALVRGRNRVMEATSRGTGELIRAAVRAGCRNVLIGVGGTATADGGAGALEALGCRYFDGKGRMLPPRLRDLLALRRIDRSLLRSTLGSARIFVLCDVRNPLLGPRGSARTFGPQKGAAPGQVRTIEKFLRHWSTFAHPRIKAWPGAGAAGATAFGLAAFAGARLVEGCPFVMKAVDWGRSARGADLIVTGEGRLDSTSFAGKVIGAVIRRKGRGRVAVVCGESRLSRAQVRRHDIDALVEMGPRGRTAPGPALIKAAERLARSYS